VLRVDFVRAGQIGDGPRHLEHPIVPRALSPSRPMAASKRRRPPASRRQYVGKCWGSMWALQ
jgi:hypothetical protein